MVQVISRGGNYLLNVGPTAEGIIPQPSVERLAEVGRWLNTNKEAVYGNGPSPFPYDLPWGLITARPGKLYLHVFDWPQNELVLFGIKNKVRQAYLLADHSKLKTVQQADRSLDHDLLRIQLPGRQPDKHDTIIVLDIEGAPLVDGSLAQQPDRGVNLPAYLADIHKAVNAPNLGLDSRGVIEKWLNKDEWVSWNFKVSSPGTFEVVVLTSEQKYGRGWEGGHQVMIDLAGKQLQGAVGNDGKQENPNNPYWKYVISKIGQVTFDKPGKYDLALKPRTINGDKQLGLTLVSVRLIPVEK
jgi:alpha-L-fucosidase